MSRQSVAVTLVVLLGVQLGLVAYFAGWFEGKPTSSAESGGGGPEQLPSEPKRREALSAFFDTLADAYRNRNGVVLASVCDNERWAEEVMDVVKREKLTAPPDFRQGLAGNMMVESFMQVMLPPWKSARIDWPSLREQQGGGEVEVLVSHRLDDGSDYHMRWWLRYSKGGWRFFDCEDRETDDRFSGSTARILTLKRDQIPQWQGAAQQLWLAEIAFKYGGVGEAGDGLGRIVLRKLPAFLEARRWLLSALVARKQGKPAKALEDCDKAEEFRKPIPLTDRLRAEAYLQTGESGRALASLAQYTGRLGEDPRTACCRGAALMMLAQLPRAMHAFRECLEDAPGKDQRGGAGNKDGARK